MARISKPINDAAVKLADQEFYRKHPERKLKPLTSSPDDAHLRHEWLGMYKDHGGSVAPEVPVVAGCRKTTLAACMKSDRKPLEVYVYVVQMEGGDPWGHVGLILQQRDGTYIRYSQQAVNSNLHGTDRLQYFLSDQETVVKERHGSDAKKLAVGGHLIRIPTEHPEQVQRAANLYIADHSHYNALTNNCAEFANHALNGAQDIAIPPVPFPKPYFFLLQRLYPDCVVQ